MLNKQAFLKEFDQKNHVMIDIETLSKGAYPVMPQISAVQFNPYTGEVFKKFDMKIDIQTMLDAGFSMDSSTVKFWLSQSKDAIDKVILTDNYHQFDIRIVLSKFAEFIKACSTSTAFIDTRVWGNGPSFDLSKLGNGYDLLKIDKPWQFFNERCVRTIVAFEPSYKKSQIFIGEKHDGLDDSIHQVGFVSATLKSVFRDDVLEQLENQALKKLDNQLEEVDDIMKSQLQINASEFIINPSSNELK